LDDIGKRAQALLEKGTVARVFDKAQDASVVIKLVDQLQKAILIYQVCVNNCQIQVGLTRVMAGVSTTIDPQSSRTIDGMFPHIVFVLELTGHLLIQDFVWCISETQRGGMARMRSGRTLMDCHW